MAKVLFSNNAVSSLAQYMDASTTTMILATGTGNMFPEIKQNSGDYFYVTLIDVNGRFEIVKVTARSADSCTIVRGQDNTTSIAFPQGSTVEQRVTAGSLNDIVSTLVEEIRSVPSSIYPIGSIYMSMNATDPSVLFGGSWNKLEDGRVLIGANSNYTVGSIGGSFTHTLTVDEIPGHSHTGTSNNTGAHTHTRGTMNITGTVRCHADGSIAQNGATGAFYNPGGGGRNIDTGGGNSNGAGFNFDASRAWTGETSSSGGHSHTITVSNTGGGKAHSLMQPYLAVHMWKRVA